jgi:PST family polysaccharide transporter
MSTTYFTVLLTGLLSFAFPRFATAAPSELGQEVRSTLRFFMATVPPLLLGAIAVRTIGMRLLYDERFTVAADILGYQLAGDVLRGASWIIAGPLLVRGQLRAFLLTEFVGACALAGLVRALLPLYGPPALGLGYVLGYAVYGGFVVAVQRHSNGIRGLWPAYLLCLGMTALALAANWCTSQSVIASPVLAASSVVLFLAGPARETVLRRVRALVGRITKS